MGYSKHEFLYHYFNMVDSNPQYPNFEMPNTDDWRNPHVAYQKKSYNWVEFLNMIDNSYPLVRARIYVSVYD